MARERVSRAVMHRAGERQCQSMATLKLKKGEIKVPELLVIRMADRLHRLGNATRRENYIARARKRPEAGHRGKNDAAVVLAAGG